MVLLVQLLIGLCSLTIVVDELKKFPNCTLVQTDWADGDSFLVADEKGNQFTVRLYGVDCLESQISDDSDARRLRGQRRYFGISNYGGNSQVSIDTAKKFGTDASTFVRQRLSQPFTVYTALADARGDGRYKRVYAFVTCSDGEDLGEKLVRVGLARAFGVYRETPDGRSREEYRERMRDQELGAAKRGVGIWSVTDWDSLPAERQQDRAELAELELAKTGFLKDGSRLNPNTAARDELMRLPGIGEVLANRIIEARPFSSIDGLSKVPGIGEKKLLKLKPFLKFD
jgi:endonuclease YncB( thermonuclease family)